MKVLKIKSKRVNFQSDDLTIKATLTTPKTSVDDSVVVIMLQGSGPVNRDSKIGPNKPFKCLAESFALNGISSFRFDKRTLTHKKEILKLKTITLDEEYIIDAFSAIEYLKSNYHFSKYFVFGHSLGAWVAPFIAKSKSLDGIILSCAPARHVLDIIYDQNLNKLKELNLKKYEYMTQLGELKELADKIYKKAYRNNETVLGLSASYWYSITDKNPLNLFKKLKIPTLIINCLNDCQVFKKDFDIWQKLKISNKNIELKNFENTNHLMSIYSNKSTGREHTKKLKFNSDISDYVSKWIINV